MRLAQGHNAMTPVRLEAAATRSRVKHSTTESLRSDDEVLFNRFFKLARKGVVRLADRLAMTIVVDLGRKAAKQTKHKYFCKHKKCCQHKICC